MSDTNSLSDAQFKRATDILKVLSHPTRLRLAMHLMGGEASVAEMERELGVGQPSLSQHLGELREANLVSTRREHKLVFYTLKDAGAIGLLEALPAILKHEGTRPVHRPTSQHQAQHGGAAMFAVVGDAA